LGSIYTIVSLKQIGRIVIFSSRIKFYLNCTIIYSRGWFIIDLVAAIPFDLLLFGSDTDEVRAANHTMICGTEKLSVYEYGFCVNLCAGL
jgi:hypothetical protein